MLFAKVENGLPREFRDDEQANHIRLFFDYQAGADLHHILVHWHLSKFEVAVCLISECHARACGYRKEFAELIQS
jgi:hypothetical protein